MQRALFCNVTWPLVVLQATAFNASYSDSGLFGVYTISQAHSAGEVITQSTPSKTNSFKTWLKLNFPECFCAGDQSCHCSSDKCGWGKRVRGWHHHCKVSPLWRSGFIRHTDVIVHFSLLCWMCSDCVECVWRMCTETRWKPITWCQ